MDLTLTKSLHRFSESSLTPQTLDGAGMKSAVPYFQQTDFGLR